LSPNFNDIWRHYRFDRRLRALISRALERIEISFRTQFAYFLSQNFGPFPLNSKTLAINAQSWADESLELNKECKKSKELFAVHFFRTYTDPILPIWALVEILSFGKITNYYRQIKSIPIKNQISNIYGLDPNILTSWLTHLYYIRNTCAHHSRLWNKRLTVLPKPPPKHISIELYSHWEFSPIVRAPDDHFNERRLYNSILVINFFLSSICPSNKWRSEISELILSYSIDATRMGFPNGWELDPFWQ
jgi:abortive infection bacteriophage resistance protein